MVRKRETEYSERVLLTATHRNDKEASTYAVDDDTIISVLREVNERAMTIE